MKRFRVFEVNCGTVRIAAGSRASVALGSRCGNRQGLADSLAAFVTQGKRHPGRSFRLRLAARRQTAHELAMIWHPAGGILDHLGKVAKDSGELLIGAE